MWALGDYPRVARDVTAAFGPELVEACAIGRGLRVLDVGAGTGSVALAAARAGADVVASDITPELLEAGRAAAEAEGLHLDWVEADAQALPFADAEFDVVTSAVGVMFAPDHEAAARELVRVVRPGGAIGLVAWTPGGWAGEFLRLVASFWPPLPPGAPSPVLWGTEEHVRELLGARTTSLVCTPRTLTLTHVPTPEALRDYYKAHFGPLMATYEALAGEPERAAELDRELLAFAERTNRARPGEPARYELAYLLAVARR
jgi:ubiquinone/menaquinone biosynthesis C-methylase UbiE